ncbi:HD-GYP domain-containing protein [Neobacillus sp. PS3-34]|uniref:HD-GYP domain-containing protein n=1 Tax=Neobacillus sp. PS3-34 TaxID=3070678 RepID=UPI0027DF9458|nr:HD-GYP domain-containing protein [Neobacillus sp. PS3-34]WML50363.1 HD-GYP domain-containing protein [Neobacillus sp. PS3-34]
MRVNINELQEGCILSHDIVGRTNRPIIPKKTVITKDLIDVLKAFLIQNADVEKTLITGMPFLPDGLLPEEDGADKTAFDNLSDLFLQSVSQFKKEFHSWQAGLPIDIAKIRALLLPVLMKMENNNSEVYNLYHYSTKDDYLYQHCLAVGIISAYIGNSMGLQKGDIVQLALAGCLADCGMAKINPAILHKKTSLTLSEYEEVKKHPIFSYRMVQNISVLRQETKLAILEHHERIDGSGYPLGEKEQKIHLYAKIIAVADIFHAMTSERLYRRKQSPFKVLEMISEDSFGKFDISIIKALVSGIINVSSGSRVLLSDGRIAEIIFIDEKQPIRPLVKIIDTEEMVQLEKNRQIFIEEILS